MGHDLTRMLRAGMPADWTLAERIVALIIADTCSDRYNRGHIPREQLRAETGLTERGVSKALMMLAARGYDFRVPHGQGKDGRFVYSARGHATDYTVPIIPPREAERPHPSVAYAGSEKGHTPVWPIERPHPSVANGPERPHPSVAPTTRKPKPPEIHKADVVSTSVEVGELARGGAPRQPIEQEAWEAIRAG